MKRVKKRGQTWSFDLIVAVILFIVVVALFYTFLSGDKYQDSVEGLEAGANTITTRLNCDLSAEGDVCIIQKGKVQQDKITTLSSKDYDELKVDFGISGDFCVYLRDAESGAIIPIDGKAGIGKDTLLLVNQSGTAVYCGDMFS